MRENQVVQEVASQEGLDTLVNISKGARIYKDLGIFGGLLTLVVMGILGIYDWKTSTELRITSLEKERQSQSEVIQELRTQQENLKNSNDSWRQGLDNRVSEIDRKLANIDGQIRTMVELLNKNPGGYRP